MFPRTELNVYKGEWGLPSIDFECLRALCIIKFSGAPIEINTAGDPFWSKSGILPYIKNDSTKIIGYREIKDFLEELSYNINEKLSYELQSLSDAYEIYVFNNIHPYFMYTLFGDPDNIDKSRALYAKRTHFPFNFYYPGKYLKLADKVMQVFGGFSVHEKLDQHNTEEITINAKKCVNLLSIKLGDKKWFFGKYHSEFDALVYAYLSVIYNISLHKNPLQMHIQECPNLVRFIKRITKEYFVKEGFSSQDKKSSSKTSNGEATNMGSDEVNSNRSKRRTQILAGLGAVAAMSTYAVWTGLLQISGDGYDEENFAYEEDDDIGEN